MEPIRTCIGCRSKAAQSQLIRLVRRGDLVIDGSRPRLPGRGAYLHPQCWELATKRHALRRAFGPGVSPAGELVDQIARLASSGPKDLE